MIGLLACFDCQLQTPSWDYRSTNDRYTSLTNFHYTIVVDISKNYFTKLQNIFQRETSLLATAMISRRRSGDADPPSLKQSFEEIVRRLAGRRLLRILSFTQRIFAWLGAFDEHLLFRILQPGLREEAV